jgi:hypothetical protein
MRSFIKILPVLLVFNNAAISQRKDNSLKNAREEVLPPYHINITIKKGDKIPVTNFGQIRLKDCRPDTSFMGAVVIDMKTGYQLLGFEGGTAPYLDGKLNKALTPAGNQETLYIKMNDFWFTETITQAGWLHAVAAGNERTLSNLFVHADLFISRGNEIRKIGTLDTSFTGKGWMPDNCEKLSEKALKAMISFAEQNASNGNELLTKSEFETINKEGILPAILGDGYFKKGIYFSFQDFLNNKAADQPFKVGSLSKQSVRLLYKEPGDTTKDLVWGFSDGKDIYMHLDTGYYRLEKNNNGFVVSAPMSIEIINAFGTRAIQKSLGFLTHFYFIYDNPFKLFALTEFMGSSPKKEIYYQNYSLCLANGKLR